MQRSLRFVLIAAILLSGLLLVSAATLQSFGTIRLRVLLSLTGLGVGAFLALIQLGALEKYRRWALGGMAVLSISQVCYHLLVWSPWTTGAILWRAWWVSFVAAAVPWCTTPIEADSSLGPDSHHPIISLSGIPSAVMVFRILHPILASTLCAANPLARIAEPTIAL